MKTVLPAFAFLSAIMTSRLVGQEDSEASRRTLAGLKGVYVLIEKISDDAQRDGLTEDQIRTDVELKLRQTGITVLSLQESVTRAGAPHLYVRVSTLKNSAEPFYAYNAAVELDQDVKLIRNPSVTSDVATWSTTMLGTVGSGNLRHLREVVRDLTDQFINAYLAANPKR